MRRAAIGVALALLACDPSVEPLSLGKRADEIRNGTRDPQAVALTDGQILALGWLHQRGNPRGPFCTGTFIRPNVIATAQHCTSGWSARNLAFGVGQDIRNPVATFDVAEIHENRQVDAALLILAQDATITLPQMTPIRANRESLDGPFDQTLRGTNVQAGGYGDTYDPSRDGRWFASVEYTGADNVFVNVDGNGRQGICFGDSGGPVIALFEDEPVVLGVESSGDSSCVGEDRLTRLDRLADWIDGIAGPEAQRPPEAPPGSPGEPDRPEEPEAPEEPELPPEEPQGQGDPEGEEDLPPPPPLPEEQAPAPDPVPAPGGTGEACGDIDEVGACQGNTLLWCQDGELHRLDCAAQGRVCVLGLAEEGAVCETVPEGFGPPPEMQMCEGVPALGLCDGNVLIRCVDGNPIETDCAANGQLCGQSNAGAVCYAAGGGGTDGIQATRAVARGGCDQAPGAPAWLSLLVLLGLRRRR